MADQDVVETDTFTLTEEAQNFDRTTTDTFTATEDPRWYLNGNLMFGWPGEPDKVAVDEFYFTETERVDKGVYDYDYPFVAKFNDFRTWVAIDQYDEF